MSILEDMKCIKNWKLKENLEENTVLYTSIGIAALGIHMLYRYGTVEQLHFILKPVAFIVAKALGMPFDFEPGLGFYNQDAYIIINKTCAGTSFWIALFCMMGFSILSKLKGLYKKIVSFTAVLLVSYGITIIANASRIIVSISVLNLGFSQMSALERLIHQSIGVLVYCSYLWMTYMAFSKWMRKG
ncbi:MAG: exosortase [Clostridia bacterium]|nr:exosortase [Clostridia bacterium]